MKSITTSQVNIMPKWAALKQPPRGAAEVLRTDMLDSKGKLLPKFQQQQEEAAAKAETEKEKLDKLLELYPEEEEEGQ